jgi:hypothetical protein
MMNMSRVSAEATAAAKHSQSPSHKLVYGGNHHHARRKLTLGVGMASIQRNTILVGDSRVKVALHLVDILGH